MTPAARVAAAINILDQIIDGQAAEQALTRWGRKNRYAGSKDRAAVRDHVYDTLRVWRSATHLGGGQTGRSLMLGMLRFRGVSPESLFTGQGHAPAMLSSNEAGFASGEPSKGIRWNLPDWLLPEFERSLGRDAEATALALQSRAPVGLRVNVKKSSQGSAIKSLSDDGVEVAPNPPAPFALTVTEGARRLRQSQAYLSGVVELQDASSQAVVDLVPDAGKILDYCAGGGGKALALAARTDGVVFAHDIDPKRMSDLPARAARAGVTIRQLSSKELEKQAPYDVVLCDAPCSGSGAWRRAPEGKWSLTEEKLSTLMNEQGKILDHAKSLLRPGGVLVYATCSVLTCENEDLVASFLARLPGWRLGVQKRFAVSDFGDGFYTAHLTQDLSAGNST